MSGTIAGKSRHHRRGHHEIRELFEQSYNDLVVEAAFEAYEDAGVSGDDIEAAWLGTYLPLGWGFDGTGGPSLAEALNLYPKPVSRVANYCTTGMEAVRMAAMAVASGMHDVVLAVGAEKMREVPPGAAWSRNTLKNFILCTRRAARRRAVSPSWQGGISRSSARIKRTSPRWREEPLPRQPEQPRALPEGDHQRAGLEGPAGHGTLGLYDCCPTTDGAAAVVLCRAELAEARFDKKDYVLIDGMGLSCATGYITTAFNPKFSFIGFEATQEAARQAYEQAGVTNPREEIDVAEVHDCFTITEILNYEDLGFVEKGEGPDFVKSGASRLGGELPVNTSGGLKSCGHPIGATGARVVADLTHQLLGRCGERQVKGAKRALGHTLGGPGAVSSVFVLSKN